MSATTHCAKAVCRSLTCLLEFTMTRKKTRGINRAVAVTWFYTKSVETIGSSKDFVADNTGASSIQPNTLIVRSYFVTKANRSQHQPGRSADAVTITGRKPSCNPTKSYLLPLRVEGAEIDLTSDERGHVASPFGMIKIVEGAPPTASIVGPIPIHKACAQAGKLLVSRISFETWDIGERNLLQQKWKVPEPRNRQWPVPAAALTCSSCAGIEPGAKRRNLGTCLVRTPNRNRQWTLDSGVQKTEIIPTFRMTVFVAFRFFDDKWMMGC